MKCPNCRCFARSMWGTVQLGINPKPVWMKAQHMLFEQGTPQHGAYSVCSGLIKIFHTNRAAKKIIYKMAQSGELIWEKSSREGLYFTSAQALIDSHLLYWSQADLEKLFHNKETPIWEITSKLLEEIQSLQESLAILAHGSVKSRVAASLLKWTDLLSADHGWNRLPTVLTLEGLAQWSGCSRQAVFAVLRSFESHDLLKKSADGWILLDRESLQEMAKELWSEPLL